jgi:hypothetical protein
MTRKEHGWTVAPAIVAAWIAAAAPAPAAATGVSWKKPGGAFEACLDGKAKAWIGAKVELVVNDDPDVGAIDDNAVAEWAMHAIKECGESAAGSDSASELQFMTHMAHWRDHIDAAASELRRRSRPD